MRLAAMTVALALAFPAGASAQGLERADAASSAFWVARGFALCPVTYAVADVAGAVARADVESCTVTLSPAWAAGELPLLWRAVDVAYGPGAALCATLAHEKGHLLGFGHSADRRSLMYPTLSPRMVPRECRN